MDAPVVVTGAEGFVGHALCARLSALGIAARTVTRASHGDLAVADEALLLRTFTGARAVIHLAGRAHVMCEQSLRPADAYRLANVAATERVAHAAARAGVEAFVFASSVKVNGDVSTPGKPFRPADPPHPQDDYARSKLDAERALGALPTTTAMRTVILRLPLVYGPGVKGNFLRLWNAVAEHRLLPLGAIENRRSLLGLDNLVDALLAATKVASGTYLLADTEAVSTPALVRAIAAALGTNARLLPVPPALLRAAGLVTGRRAAVERLTSSLEIDSAAFALAANWQARQTLAEGLAKMRPARS
jgi:nucleoside-diphosphate-sugar epimerase